MRQTRGEGTKLPEDKTPEPIISLNQVSKVYTIGTTKLRALDEVSLNIYPGEFACIVGRSGSGKSTLLNMIAGLEKPTKGRIRVAGKEIDRLSESKLVQFRLDNVGFVFQQFNLFATHTALDNVAMPLMYKGVPKDVRMRRARKMLELVGLSSHMAHMPTQMSGGQQQRVGIARSLVTKPKILFADEPTGNLDLKTSREILRLIRSVCRERGTTLIMVTHDSEIAEYADRVIRLLDGRVIEDIKQENPKEIALVQTLPDGTVIEMPDGEASAEKGAAAARA
jgi:putative ABC transport system ATP-binding protein